MDLVIENPKIKDKCQIFTPNDIVEKMLDMAGYNIHLWGKKVLENSCGDGQILAAVVKRYIEASKNQRISKKKIKEGLESDIVAYDIDSEWVDKCKKRLSDIATSYGILDVSWNIKCRDFLQETVNKNYDFIIGNPPYIAYPDLDEETRKYVRDNFKTCKKGKFDYCYAFIEKSYELLTNGGVLVYIIPSNMFKNVFAAELRTLIKADIGEIYDYPNDKIFNEALVSPAIIKVVKGSATAVLKYTQSVGDEIQEKNISKTDLSKKWVFDRSSNKSGVRVGDYFRVSSCIATLLNEAFVIRNCEIDDEYCYTDKGKIERALIKKAASPKNKKYNKHTEYIIFPYYYDSNGILAHYSELEMEEKFPFALQYLNSFRKKLDARKADTSAKWYEYGRSQALQNANKEMILVSSVISECTKVYLLSSDEIPYSGLYIIPTGGITLGELLSQLNSADFIRHIFKVGVCVNGKSKRITPSDIENYTY
jgi:methylase of polypeptide subunit release factors